MNPSEIRAAADWGWDRYERTHWRDQSDRRIYVGHFRAPDGPMGFRACQITFAAKHPVLAMRHIARSGLDPMTFHDTQVN